MFQNLGIALGAGVDEYHRQQDESRKQTAESRADTQFKQQQAQYTRQQKIRDTRDKLIKEYQDFDGYLKGMDGVADDKLADYVRQGVTRYNTNPYYKNGLFGQVVEHKGAPHIAHGSFQDQNLEYIPVTREHAKQAGAAMQQMLREQLAMVDSDKMEGFLDHREKMGLEGRKVGVEEKKATDAAAYQQGILGWHNKQAERPHFIQDGTGRVLAISPDGKLLGTFGSPRPVVGHGGGSGGGMGLTDEQASLLNQAMQYEEYAKQLSKSNPAAAQQYRNASIRALDGLPAKVQLGFRGKFGNAPQDIDPWDMPVKMKKMDPKTGVEIESQVPMKVADPEGFAKYQRGLAYSNINLGGASQQPAAVKETAPYVTRRGMNFVVVDPTTNRMEPTSDYERRTGNAWADLPVR